MQGRIHGHKSDGHGNKKEFLFLAARAPRDKIYVNMTGVRTLLTRSSHVRVLIKISGLL